MMVGSATPLTQIRIVVMRPLELNVHRLHPGDPGQCVGNAV